jgi:hypothetical protein
LLCRSREERERRGEKQFDTGKRLQSCQSLFFTFFWREEKARERQKEQPVIVLVKGGKRKKRRKAVRHG